MATQNQSAQTGKGERGFAGMDESKQREISRMGGEAVSQDRQHMSEIGQKGGEASHGGGGQSSSNSRSNSGSNSGSSNSRERDSNSRSASGQGSSGSQRGGSSEQHAEAGRQSHKNR